MEIQQFERKKKYLVCVDSDGCAMDTMDIKHKKCFGPCLVEEWQLQSWQEKVLCRWNEINLYSTTRGINRFKGLYMMLNEIDGQITHIDGLDQLRAWVESTKEFSNASLKREIEKNPSQCLIKALDWSERLNRRIDELTDEEKTPFEGVRDTLEKMHANADVAIVSSANKKAVEEEWTKYGLFEFVDIMLTQEEGNKEYCIEQMKKKGYGEEQVLMVGDAVGDYMAAKCNNVLFFPILVKRETQSWKTLRADGLTRLFTNSYDREYQQSLITQFYNNFAN